MNTPSILEFFYSEVLVCVKKWHATIIARLKVGDRISCDRRLFCAGQGSWRKALITPYQVPVELLVTAMPNTPHPRLLVPTR